MIPPRLEIYQQDSEEKEKPFFRVKIYNR